MDRSYRQAMFAAFSFPILLFVTIPLAVVAFVGPSPSGHGLSILALLALLALLAAILAPIYSAGFVLAPWAGRRIPETKAPAFLMAATSALSPVVLLLFIAMFRGELGSSLGTLLFFTFFALPASLLGALLFIGRCQRLHTVTSH